jgi:hypothetical protein
VYLLGLPDSEWLAKFTKQTARLPDPYKPPTHEIHESTMLLIFKTYSLLGRGFYMSKLQEIEETTLSCPVDLRGDPN